LAQVLIPVLYLCKKTFNNNYYETCINSFVIAWQYSFGYAQYSKEKLTEILTGGSTKSWIVKGAAAGLKGIHLRQET